MSSNFSINPNFQNNTDNSIKDFNKIFSSSLQNTTKTLSSQDDFEKVFNGMSNVKQEPVQGSVQAFVGMDSISASKIDNYNISDSARMASDIQKGFANGINELNTISKQAEDDFETFASGGDISVHDVMISAQKSSLAMQMALQLRNQMINAYNEFKTMPV